jgi:hypothetical protein
MATQRGTEHSPVRGVPKTFGPQQGLLPEQRAQGTAGHMVQLPAGSEDPVNPLRVPYQQSRLGPRAKFENTSGVTFVGVQEWQRLEREAELVSVH